jgi:hypothetical protein
MLSATDYFGNTDHLNLRRCSQKVQNILIRSSYCAKFDDFPHGLQRNTDLVLDIATKGSGKLGISPRLARVTSLAFCVVSYFCMNDEFRGLQGVV